MIMYSSVSLFFASLIHLCLLNASLPVDLYWRKMLIYSFGPSGTITNNNAHSEAIHLLWNNINKILDAAGFIWKTKVVRYLRRCLLLSTILFYSSHGSQVCLWEKLMQISRDSTLTSLFRLNLINVYHHRHDCSLACSSHLAEQFQMHSLEPEGFQLT